MTDEQIAVLRHGGEEVGVTRRWVFQLLDRQRAEYTAATHSSISRAQTLTLLRRAYGGAAPTDLHPFTRRWAEEWVREEDKDKKGDADA